MGSQSWLMTERLNWIDKSKYSWLSWWFRLYVFSAGAWVQSLVGEVSHAAVWQEKMSKHFLLEFSSFNVIFNDCLIVHLLTGILTIPFYVTFVLFIYLFEIQRKPLPKKTHSWSKEKSDQKHLHLMLVAPHLRCSEPTCRCLDP